MPELKYIPLACFPRSFQADVGRLLSARQDTSLFCDHLWKRSISPAAAEGMKRRIHRAADALVRAGEPLERITSLKVLTSPASVKRIIRVCNDERGRRPNFDNWYLISGLRSIGKKYLRQDQDDQAELERLHKRLPDPRGAMGRSYGDLLQQFDDPDALVRLAGAPSKIWKELISEIRLTGHTLARAQRALGLDLMINAAPLLHALVGLSFEQLQLDDPDGWGALHLTGDQTPSGQPLQCPLPPDAAGRLRDYRDEIYPSVAGVAPKYVFGARDGRPKTKNQIRNLIVEGARRSANVKVSPQMFRALAGMLMIRSGKSIGEVAQALGCKSTQALSSQFEDILRDEVAEEYSQHVSPQNI